MTSPTEKLTDIVSARFTAAEIAELRELAAGRPLSQVVRELAIGAARQRTRPQPPHTSHQARTTAARRVVTNLGNFPGASTVPQSAVVRSF